MNNITNILLFLTIVFLSYFIIRNIFNYFKSFKNRYFNAGVSMGTTKTMRVIIEKAKEGKSFKLKDAQDEIKLKIVNKKNQ